MTKTLQVSEKFSKYWLPVMAGSFVASIALLTGYIFTDNALLESYLRLGAFAFFVIGFLSLFKLNDGKSTITYELSEDTHILEITYSVRGRKTHSESIDFRDVKAVKVDQMPNRSIYNDFYKADRSVRIQKKNMDGWMNLNEIHGRTIPLSRENAEKVIQYLLQSNTSEINIQNVT
ncbi:MAG: hypothetical protein R6V27_09905 [Balneolaceae bacterium]